MEDTRYDSGGGLRGSEGAVSPPAAPYGPSSMALLHQRPASRNPKCARCRNHGLITEMKAHKSYCPFSHCVCVHCMLVEERRRVMAMQVAHRRAQALDEQEDIFTSSDDPFVPILSPDESSSRSITFAFTSIRGSEKEDKTSYRLPPPPYQTMSQPDSGGADLAFWIVLMLSQLVGIVSVALVIYWCTLYGGFAWTSDANQQFFYHPLLMVLGLIFFYGEAVLVYRALYFLPKWILKIVHAMLHIFAIVSSSVGLAAVFENHRRTNKADLYSLHSWLGIVTFGFFCIQYIVGFVSFLFPGLPMSMRAKAMPFHTFFGVGLFIMSVASAELGLTQRLIWTTGYTSGLKEATFPKAGVVGNILGLFLVVFAFLVVYLATHSKYKRKPLLLESAVAPTN